MWLERGGKKVGIIAAENIPLPSSKVAQRDLLLSSDAMLKVVATKKQHKIDKWQTDFHFLWGAFFAATATAMVLPSFFVPNDISIFPLCHFLTSLLEIWDDLSSLNATKILENQDPKIFEFLLPKLA